MECCSICLGQLEEGKNWCQDCIRSKQEQYKEQIREKKTVLQLLNHERKSLKKRIKAQVESNLEQWQHTSDTNVKAANLRAVRETTLKYAQETVKKEEKEIEELQTNLKERREALEKSKAFLLVLQKRLQEVREKNMLAYPPNTTTSTPETGTTTTTTTTTTSTTTTTTNTTTTSILPPTNPPLSSTTTAPSSITTSKISHVPSSTHSSSSHRSSTHSSSTTTSTRTSSSHTSSGHSNHPSSTHRSTSSSQTSSSTTPTKSSTPSKHHSSSKHGSSHKSSSSHHKNPPAPVYFTLADLQNVSMQLARTRRALITELLSFFPINPSPTASETETIILNVTMPNNGVYTYYRPDALSTALGYVAHVVYIIAGYLGVTLPWQIDFAGARSVIHDPFHGRKHNLFGTRYDDIEPGLIFLNRAIVYLCGSQGVHVPLSQHNCTLPNLLSLLRCPTLGMPGPLEALRPEPVVRVSRPPLRVKEPPSPVVKKAPATNQISPVVVKKILQKDDNEEEDDEFIVVENPSVPTPEQTEELEHFERAMFVDTV